MLIQLQPQHIEVNLESIKSFLYKHNLVNLKKLSEVSKQLKKINKSIIDTAKNNQSYFSEHFKNQRELIENLIGRCNQLKIRINIVNFAESAESLSNTSPHRSRDEVAIEANNLRLRIVAFLKNYRPSQIDSKFIRFARVCINKAEKGEAVIVERSGGKIKLIVSLQDFFKNKEVTKESYEIAELLYELSMEVHYNNISNFKKLIENFSKDTINEIKHHVKICGGDIDKVNTAANRTLIMQGILGYAHLLVDYYMDKTPYPTVPEIEEICSDVNFINRH